MSRSSPAEEERAAPAIPRIAVTPGDPRGIGPEVLAAALTDPEVSAAARWVVVGPEGLGLPGGGDVDALPVGRWDAARGSEREAGRLAGDAVERAVGLALDGDADGLVTGPISKAALAAAGWLHPGHTELLRERAGVPEVVMMMAAEETPLRGPLRMALLTGHIPLREVPARLTAGLATTRALLASRALREWWAIRRPRLCFAGVNPHAGEGGMFGDEEERVLEPAARAVREEGAEVIGIVPADTAFRRCVDGSVDLVVVPYHDVGLAVLKTVARDAGVNVTAGLPFPRTAPDHGTALDIAASGLANPGAMRAALLLCARFCRETVASRAAAGALSGAASGERA